MSSEGLSSLPTPKKGLFLSNEGLSWSQNKWITTYSIHGIGTSKTEFENYVLSRVESWTHQGLLPTVKKIHTKDRYFIGYVEFPGSVSFEKSLLPFGRGFKYHN